MTSAASESIPSHVPAELVFDFDFLDPPMHQEDVQAGWYQVKREHPPLFWTPRNGGHWVATRGADIRMVESDVSRFSSKVPVLPYDPKRAIPTPPFDLDPPEHAPFRRAIAPSFTPKVIALVEDRFRAMAVETIEGFRARGECEFVSEFSRVLPITAFMTMVGLPIEDGDFLRSKTELIVRGTVEMKRQVMLDIAQYLGAVAMRRAQNPADDPISRIVTSEVNGERMPLARAIQTTVGLLAAGLDTVSSLMGFVARFLASHPEHRRRLIDDPAIRPKALEELMRRFGVINHTRLVIEDTEIAGIRIKAGDIVQMATALVGLDDALNADPLTVDFDRVRPDHGLFGAGPHRCPGAVLAQREMLVFVDEWLRLIPDFEVKPGTVPRVASGTVCTHSELYLSWPAPVA